MRRLTRKILGPWRWLCLREARYTRRLRNIERYERQREQQERQNRERLEATVAKMREACDRLKKKRAEEHDHKLRQIGMIR